MSSSEATKFIWSSGSIRATDSACQPGRDDHTPVPVGISLGLGAPVLIALFPAVNGYFFLPTYPTLLAAISFDQTGTTRGKYILNHSFMLSGMVATISSLVLAYLIARIVH